MRINFATLLLLLLPCVLVMGCGNGDEASPTEEPAPTSTADVAQESHDTGSTITTAEGVEKDPYLEQIGVACTEARLKAELAQRRAQSETDPQAAVKYSKKLAGVFSTEVARIREVVAPPELGDEVEAYVTAEDAIIRIVSKLADEFSAAGGADATETRRLLAAWTGQQKAAAEAQHELGLDCPALSPASN